MIKLRRFAAILILVLLVATSVYAFTIARSNYGTSTTATFSGSTTTGNSLIAAVGTCGTSSCGSSTSCGTQSFSDSPGGGTWSTVFQPGTVTGICVALGLAKNITSSASDVTTCGGTNSFPVCFAAEVTGLGSSPTVSTTGVNSGSGITSVATTGSSTSGDFCFASFYSGATPSAGSGWTLIGTAANHQLVEWQSSSGGTVTATVTGTSGGTGASIACITPSSAAPACRPSIAVTGAGSC